MKRKWLMVIGIMVLMCACIIMTGCSADTQVTITRNADDSEDVVTQVTISLTDFQALDAASQSELMTAGFKQTTVDGQAIMALTKSQHVDDFHNVGTVLSVDNSYGKIEVISMGNTYYDWQQLQISMYVDPKAAILSKMEGEYGLKNGRLVGLKDQITLIYTLKTGEEMRNNTTGGLPNGVWIENGKIAYIDFDQIRTNGDERFYFSIIGENPLPAEEPVTSFTDVQQGSWYYEYVMQALNEGLVNGYDDGSYGPENHVSVAEVAQMLYNMGTDNVGHNFWSYPDKHWAFQALLVAKNYGAIDGTVSIQDISPFNVDCTREQAAYFIAKLMQHNLGISASGNHVSIPDINEVSSQYKDAVQYLYDLGIMSGMDDAGTFAPKRTVTRAEMAKIILGAWEIRPSDFQQWKVKQPYYKWDGIHRDIKDLPPSNTPLDELTYWMKQHSYEIGVTDPEDEDIGKPPTWN